MEAVESKEEHIVDVNINQDSYDEQPSEPQEVILSSETETVNYPSRKVNLCELSKMLWKVIGSNKTKTKKETACSEDTSVLSNNGILSPKNAIESPNIQIINNTSSIEAQTDSSTALTDGNKNDALAVAQCSERENGPITRKRKASNISTPQKDPKLGLESWNKLGLKNVAVNIGPLPPSIFSECSSSSLKLKIFSCNKCSIKFTDSAAHNAHVDSCGIILDKSDWFMDSARLFHCRICIYKFEKITNLQNHMAMHPSKNFTCNICSDEFVTPDELHVHNNETHKAKSPMKIYRCNVCSYSTSSYFHLKEHLIQHIPDRHLYCYRCKRNCEDKNNYDQHKAKLHGNVESKKRKLTNSDHDPVPDKMTKQEALQNVDNTVDKEADFNSAEQSVNYTMPPVTNNYLEKLRSNYESEIILIKGVYYCCTCVYKFSKLESLIKHMKQHFDAQRPFRCHKCKYESFSVVNMETHCKQTCHRKTGKCNECSFKCREWKFVKRHAINHIYDGLFCRQCSLNFENYESFKDHMLIMHDVTSVEKMHFCNQCSFSHAKYTAFRTHFKLNHLGRRKRVQEENFKRPVKTKPSQDEEEVNIVGRSENIMIQNQTIIGSNSSNADNTRNCHSDKNVCLRRTSRSSTSHKLLQYRFKCAKCDFTSNEFGSFIKHSAQEHMNSEKPFKCSICFRKISLLKLYLKHMSLHDGILIYECQYCKYSSMNEVEFSKHASNHETYTCPMCVYNTFNIELFKNHIEKQHKPGGIFSCPLCPYSVNVEQSLSLHCLRFHTQQFCQTKLSVPHSLSYERGKVIGCKLCSFTCKKSKSYDLKRHVIKHYTDSSLRKLKSKKLGLNRMKQSTRGLIQRSKQRNTKLNNRDNYSNYCYYCSKCNKKSKHRCDISKHLRIHHNIIGGVRNNMILKFPIQIPDQNSTKCTDIPAKHTPEGHESESSNEFKSESNDSMKASTSTVPNEDTKQVANNSNESKKYLEYSCGKCSMKSRHKRSVWNHLKCVHKIVGKGIKNKFIIKMSRNSTEANKEANKSNSVVTQTISDDFSLEVIPNVNEDREINVSSNLQQRVEKKQSIPENSIYYYKCSKCDFKGSMRRPMYIHLLKFHNIVGGLRDSKILKVYGRVDKLQQDKKTIQNYDQKTMNEMVKESTSFNKNTSPTKQELLKPDKLKQKIIKRSNRKTSNKNMNNTTNSKKSRSSSKQDLLNLVQNKSTTIMKTSKNDDGYYCCSLCNMKTKFINALKAHLRRHKRGGALKKKMVLKAFNDQPRFDSLEIATSISNTSGLITNSIDHTSDLQSRNKEEQSTAQVVVETSDLQSRNGEELSTVQVVEETSDLQSRNGEELSTVQVVEETSDLQSRNKEELSTTQVVQETSDLQSRNGEELSTVQVVEETSDLQSRNKKEQSTVHVVEETSDLPRIKEEQSTAHGVEETSDLQSIIKEEQSTSHVNGETSGLQSTAHVNEETSDLQSRIKKEQSPTDVNDGTSGLQSTAHVNEGTSDLQSRIKEEQSPTDVNDETSGLQSTSHVNEETSDLQSRIKKEQSPTDVNEETIEEQAMTHIVEETSDLQSRNKEEQSTAHVVEETKESHPSISSHSGSTSFICSLCSYKYKFRRLLFNHLLKYHKVDMQKLENVPENQLETQNLLETSTLQ